jgi:hypothetical protein
MADAAFLPPIGAGGFRKKLFVVGTAGRRTLVLVGIHHGLGDALALVIACPGPDGVHVAPVRLGLRVHLGVTVYLQPGARKLKLSSSKVVEREA